MPVTILEAAEQRFLSGNTLWEYGQRYPGQDTDGNDRLEIDCTNLTWESLKVAGYSGIPYENTTTLRTSKYYSHIQPEHADQARVGDLVLFRGHAGIVKYWDPATGTGVMVNSLGRALGATGRDTRDDAREDGLLSRGPQYTLFTLTGAHASKALLPSGLLAEISETSGNGTELGSTIGSGRGVTQFLRPKDEYHSSFSPELEPPSSVSGIVDFCVVSTPFLAQVAQIFSMAQSVAASSNRPTSPRPER